MQALFCRISFGFFLWCDRCLHIVGALCNNLNEPLDPFPFGVAVEQKGGQG